MIEYCVYCSENGERYVAHYGEPSWYSNVIPRGKREFPDEVKILGIPLIKREKTLAEMTPDDFKGYGHHFRYAAKDIPLSRAMPKEWK